MLQKIVRVTTASGKKVLKSECCTINGEYFIKDKEAVKIGTTWFIIGDPRIFMIMHLNPGEKLGVLILQKEL